MSCLDKIITDLAAITDAQVLHALATMDPPKKDETVLQVVASPDLHRLWTLAHDYDKQARKLAWEGLYNSASKTDRDTLLMRGRYIEALGDLVRDMVWADVKEEIGALAWNADQIGIREGFTIISKPESGPTIKEIPAGALVSPSSELLQILKRVLEGTTPPEDPEKGRKPQ